MQTIADINNCYKKIYFFFSSDTLQQYNSTGTLFTALARW